MYNLFCIDGVTFFMVQPRDIMSATLDQIEEAIELAGKDRVLGLELVHPN